jgi:hypothetical protein
MFHHEDFGGRFVGGYHDMVVNVELGGKWYVFGFDYRTGGVRGGLVGESMGCAGLL